jgi:hypothetical protein
VNMAVPFAPVFPTGTGPVDEFDPRYRLATAFDPEASPPCSVAVGR